MDKKFITFLNYLGRLQIYSLLDLIVLATAISRDIKVVFGVIFLWVSFLFYRETRRADDHNLKINKHLWIVTFIVSAFFLPILVCLGFALCSYFYAKKKKEKIWGISASFWRGFQYVAIVAAYDLKLSLLVFVLIFIRSLIADFRDAGDDAKRNIQTIPVALGINKNQVWALYSHMIFISLTTVVWSRFSFLDGRWIILIIILQIITYPFTPRMSNPKYFSFYDEV